MTNQNLNLPGPIESEEAAKYWAAANDERLSLRRCLDTNKAYFPPYERSPFTGSTNTEAFDASGNATLYAYSVLVRTKEPYCLAYVQLEEGPIVLSNIATADYDQLSIGQPLRIVFAESSTGQKVPVFAPAR